MKTLSTIVIVLSLLSSAVAGQEDVSSSTEDSSPQIELVFCLDATGSMSGLIHTAKEKIWDIVTVMSQAEPAPEIKLGMLFYRDRGDAFVTRMYPLTIDIDSIYSVLLEIEAYGGGDSPESVNQGLYEAVMNMGWSDAENVYRTVFLVGDCPPHMDYDQDIRYPKTCKLAVEKGIVINTIKLGMQCSDAIQHFQAIATLTNGEYQQYGQDANDIIILTPYDDSISYYSNCIDASKIYYGNEELQEVMVSKQEAALGLYDKSSRNAVASRASFSMTKSGKENFYGENELIQMILDDEIELEDIPRDELPEKMKGMSEKEKKAYVEEMTKTRAANLDAMKELMKKREAYILEKKKENPEEASFSDEIFKIARDQAAVKGVNFKK